MREAARQDAWRRVGPDWPPDQALTVLEVRDVPGVTPGSVPLFGGMSILCGSNAAGKTRMLAAIMNSIETGDQSRVALSGTTGGAIVEFIDTFWLLQKQRLSLGQDKALDERVAQAGLARMRAEDVRLASYLLGRQYEAVEFAELEATDDDQLLIATAPEDPLIQRALQLNADVVPYFRVERGGHAFDSTALSQGELAGLTLLWALNRLPEGCVLVIDEPETFLAPLSAQRCLDILALFSHKKSVNCFVSSHSYLGLATAPPDHLLLLEPSSRGEVRLQRASEARLWSTLRLAPPKPIVFVVEDEAAKQWLNSLLAESALPDKDCADVWVGGHADAVRDAAKFPSEARGARYVVWGVLDGDERRKRRRGAEGKLLYLPGDKSPEGLILDVLSQGRVQVPGMDMERARACCARHEGEDLHDVVALVSAELGLAVTVLREVVLQTWLRETEEGLAAKQAFMTGLSAVKMPPLLTGS